MRPGSIVHCINNAKYPEFVKLETRYTVREIIKKDDVVINAGAAGDFYALEDGIRLEEITIQSALNIYIFPFGNRTIQFESPFPMKDFRELLPPIENIEEHINENTIEPVLK